jgi:hypothetical protein
MVYAWFVTKLLATNGYPSISLTDYCKKICQVWAEDFLAKIGKPKFANI